MIVKEIIKRLEHNKEFEKWKKENYASSLAHIFKMFDEANKDEVQVGFFNPNETITTFIVGKEVKKVEENSEIFKKPDSKVMKLSIEDVRIDIEKAMKIAREYQLEYYKNEKPTKEMLVLQHLELGQIYNITFITQAFKTLNIKIDAKNGEVLKHDLISLTDLKAK